MAKKSVSKNRTQEKHLAVALQGGGSHGAFTWGVLDRLLEEENLKLDGFCGTSAGAMNATVLAYGLMLGGREKARELLHLFWTKISESSRFSLLQPTWLDKLNSEGNMDYSPGFLYFEFLSMFSSPFQFNPLDYNPLRDVLLEIVDFDKLKSCQETKLFVCATNVRTGRAKVFDLKNISIDAVMASGCLPFLFKTVTIDGEDYWDGGYMGNPPIFPLIDGTNCSDILIVQVNPIHIEKSPTEAPAIRDRINEISFNTPLMLEMRKVAFIDRLLDMGINPEGKFRRIYIHQINPEKDIAEYNVSSKLNATWDFIEHLFKMGRRYASEWLDLHYDSIGVRSSCDIRKTFL
ncbi:MAG: patatin-like phospholipase family protein [Raineya sp.]|nr:patatin-like phospholipase family protein [Raineya sp.]MDW8296957.1 patatin-like phospholipase family protein [Raineya sp.]